MQLYCRSLEQKGYSVHNQPNFKDPTGTLLKPDIAYSTDHSVLIDAQVINNQYPLDIAHENKVSKYSCLRGQLQHFQPQGTLITILPSTGMDAIPRAHLKIYISSPISSPKETVKYYPVEL